MAKKIGRQLSVASHGNHYAEYHRQETERALNGQTGLASPSSGHKEGFFSHLRKRARRLSGRYYQTPLSPNSDDIEANAGCAPWASSNRQSMIVEPAMGAPSTNSDYSEMDKALNNVRCSLETTPQSTTTTKSSRATNPMLKRHHSVPHGQDARSSDHSLTQVNGPISSRTRRALQNKTHPSNRYETPNEEEELLNEALAAAHKANKRLNHPNQQPNMNAQASKILRTPAATDIAASLYLTPSPSANRNGVGFGQSHQQQTPSKPMNISKPPPPKNDAPSKWPTPPYDENDWASTVSASLLATQSMYR